MQNQNNNNNIMMSRQSGTGSRSGTPNSMVVLEQGLDSLSGPPSGRRSVNRRSPLKRGESSLEILPAEEDDSSSASSRLSNDGANKDTLRQTQSARSVSQLSPSEVEEGIGDGKGGGAGLKRSSSNEGKSEVVTPDLPRKQVYLTTVKRNFEQHGMPKNEELAKAVQNRHSLVNGTISNSPSPTHTHHNLPHRKQHKGKSDRLETDAENNDPANIEKGLERITLGKAGGQRLNDNGHGNEMTNTDSYYISHGNSAKASTSASSSAESDPHYLTHDSLTSLSTTSETGQTARDKVDEPTTQTNQVPVTSTTSEVTTTTSEVTEGQEDENESDDDDDNDEENEEHEEAKAPFQLLGEFLEAVMEEDYENAEKLCKMVLLYEPDNAEAKQFQPLIEEMLKREREAQLWGSESEDDEDADDEVDSDDDDGDEDSDEDEEDDEESSSEEEDLADEDKSDTHVKK